MSQESKDYFIKQGLDNEDIYFLWPLSEWAISFSIGGFLVSFGSTMLGIFTLFALLFICRKFRNEVRGYKSHFLWKIGMNKSKKGLPWAPPAYATRFDN